MVRSDTRKPIRPTGRNDKTKLLEKNPYRVLSDIGRDAFLVGSEEVFGGDGRDGGPRRAKSYIVPVLLGEGGKSDDRVPSGKVVFPARWKKRGHSSHRPWPTSRERTWLEEDTSPLKRGRNLSLERERVVVPLVSGVEEKVLLKATTNCDDERFGGFWDGAEAIDPFRSRTSESILEGDEAESSMDLRSA